MSNFSKSSHLYTSASDIHASEIEAALAKTDSVRGDRGAESKAISELPPVEQHKAIS